MQSRHSLTLLLYVLSLTRCGDEPGDRPGTAPDAATPSATPLLRPPAPAPASAEEAARQLGDWLTEPTRAPVPALLTPTSELVFDMHCGTCDIEPTIKTTTVVGVDAIAGLADELRRSSLLGTWDAGPTIVCRHDCCEFPPAGSSDHVIDVLSVCLRTDADGRPTDYTRLVSSGAWPEAPAH